MERYVLRGGRWGYDRLRILARVRRAETLELLGRAGVGPGQRCVDLGSGSGEVSFELARLTGPDGSVTGIDMDEVKVALAREAAAERGLGNVEFRAADVNDWAEPGAYDRPGRLRRRPADGVRQSANLPALGPAPARLDLPA